MIVVEGLFALLEAKLREMMSLKIFVDTAADLYFDKHKASIQANSYAQKYGLRLPPDLYEAFNPMSYKEAVDKEIEGGIDLRAVGVWGVAGLNA